MKIKSGRLRAMPALALAAALFSGCSEIPETRVEVPNFTINDHPVSMVLDTGASGLMLTQAGASQADLKYDSPPRSGTLVVNGITASFSEPARVKVGDVDITIPIRIFPLPWYMRWPLAGDFPGWVGWDMVKNNILVFDPVHRTITAVEQLPAETAGWTKLKIHSDGNLVLEMPQPDGKTGLILVDTGSPLGIGLPEEEFKKWRAAHPGAPLVREFYGAMEESDSLSFDYYDFWADDISFLSQTFTHMPVHNEYSIESSFAGTLGMYALTQLDLVVDGKNGFAYLHTKKSDADVGPADGRDAPGPASKGDWVFAGDIQLNSGPIFLDSANYKLGAGDYPGAIADLEQALKLDPKNEHTQWLIAMAKLQSNDLAGSQTAWNGLLQLKPGSLDYAMMRAWVRLRLGDYGGAIADYTNVLKAHPDDPDAFLYRGVTEECRGDLAPALADYDEVIRLKPDDSTSSRLFRQLILPRLNRAPEDFSPVVATWKVGWEKTLGKYVAGEIDENALLAAAGDKKNPPVSGHQCQAYYLIGMMRFIHGDKAGARAAWRQALNTGQHDYNMYLLAQAQLAMLDVPPSSE